MLKSSTVKIVLFIYLVFILFISVVPLGGMSKSLSDTTVLSIRGDYLLHALVFLPLVPLWKFSIPSHTLWLVIPVGLLLAAGTEYSHYYLPYRAYNVNDLVANMLGVFIGALIYLVMPKAVLPPQP